MIFLEIIIDINLMLNKMSKCIYLKIYLRFLRCLWIEIYFLIELYVSVVYIYAGCRSNPCRHASWSDAAMPCEILQA